VRDARETDALSMDRYDLIRGAQRDAQPVKSTMIPVNEAPILAPIVNPTIPARPKPVAPQPLGLSGDSATPAPSQPVAPLLH
jgi:general secretion pathway protein D